MKTSIVKQFKDGFVDNNPIFVQFLGMCSALAITTSVTNAIGMGLSVTAVLICSNILISLLRKFIVPQIRIAAFIVIISGFVTAVELLIKAYLPDLNKSLGLFIPLIVVNCIILARAESFASKNGVFASAIDGLTMGLGYTAAIIVVSFVREILGTGAVLASSDGSGGITLLGSWYTPANIFILPPGAFLTLAFLVALFQKLKSRDKKKAKIKKEKEEIIPDEDVFPKNEEKNVEKTPIKSEPITDKNKKSEETVIEKTAEKEIIASEPASEKSTPVIKKVTEEDSKTEQVSEKSAPVIEEVTEEDSKKEPASEESAPVIEKGIEENSKIEQVSEESTPVIEEVTEEDSKKESVSEESVPVIEEVTEKNNSIESADDFILSERKVISDKPKYIEIPFDNGEKSSEKADGADNKPTLEDLIKAAEDEKRRFAEEEARLKNSEADKNLLIMKMFQDETEEGKK